MTGTDRRSADPAALLQIAGRLAGEAASLLSEGLGRARSSVDTKSSATDMVTEMDRASEALLARRLDELRPDDAVLGEEGTERAGTTGVRWVLDPLDGTTNYLYGHAGWNVSVGAEVDGEPVVGAVIVPATGDTFLAARGHGATHNGVRLVLAPPAPLDACLVGTGFNYDAALRVRQAEALVTIIGRVRDIRRGGAAAADLCAVACGRLDAYYENGLAPWDRVAGFAIAAEAGAATAVLDPTPLGRDCTVAAHPARIEDLLELLAEAGVVGMPARTLSDEARWAPYGDTNPHR